MDGGTYALLKKKINEVNNKVSSLAEGFSYKGSVPSVEDLPASATAGDMYTVSGAKYVYDGSAWVMIDPITTEQIDAFYT